MLAHDESFSSEHGVAVYAVTLHRRRGDVRVRTAGIEQDIHARYPAS